jgi:hypothetical protein
MLCPAEEGFLIQDESELYLAEAAWKLTIKEKGLNWKGKRCVVAGKTARAYSTRVRVRD